MAELKALVQLLPNEARSGNDLSGTSTGSSNSDLPAPATEEPAPALPDLEPMPPVNLADAFDAASHQLAAEAPADMLQHPSCVALMRVWHATKKPRIVLSISSSEEEPCAESAAAAPSAWGYAEEITKRVKETPFVGTEVLALQRAAKARAKEEAGEKADAKRKGAKSQGKKAKKGKKKQAQGKTKQAKGKGKLGKQDKDKEKKGKESDLPSEARRPAGSVGKFSWTLRCQDSNKTPVGRISVLLRSAAFYVKPTVDCGEEFQRDAANGSFIAWAGDVHAAWAMAQKAAGWV